MQGYIRKENSEGVPYYITDEVGTIQWDHPKFVKIKQNLEECNVIRYSAYRVASKLRILQKALLTNSLPLALCAGVFVRHRLGSMELSLLLESCELEAVLSDIYFAAQKYRFISGEVDTATELLLNLLYNIYDRNREGKLQVISAKTCIAVLSTASLTDLHRYLYSLAADHNNCVTRRRLHLLLDQLAAIAEFLQEGSMFGRELVPSAVDSCFSNSPGMVGVNEDTFMKWLQDCPPIVSWLNTFNRLRSAETVIHHTKCSACKISPIIGLRYKCVRCSRYIQCQACYFTGRVSHSHKLKHAMQEFCTEESTREVTQAFLKKLRNFLHCMKVKNVSNSTENIKPILSSESTEVDDNVSTLTTDISTSTLSVEEQLSAVIGHLEQQNLQLQQQMSSLCSSTTDRDVWRCLEEHRMQVATQVKKLKLLKQYLQNEQPLLRNVIDLESTPMVNNKKDINHRQVQRADMEIFSPIVISQSKDTHSSENLTSINECSSLSAAPNSAYYDTLPVCTAQDLSTWIGGKPTTDANSLIQSSSMSSVSKVREVHGDLDTVLEKLQEILANNFAFDDTASTDNGQLKSAVTEMEDMLSTLIDGVEKSRSKKIENESE